MASGTGEISESMDYSGQNPRTLQKKPSVSNGGSNNLVGGTLPFYDKGNQLYQEQMQVYFKQVEEIKQTRELVNQFL